MDEDLKPALRQKAAGLVAQLRSAEREVRVTVGRVAAAA